MELKVLTKPKPIFLSFPMIILDGIERSCDQLEWRVGKWEIILDGIERENVWELEDVNAEVR